MQRGMNERTQLVLRAFWVHSKEYDKQQHFFYSLLLLLTTSLVVQLWAAVAVVAAIGLAKECWDHVWGSGFCWVDMLANGLGIAAGTLIWWGANLTFSGVIERLM